MTLLENRDTREMPTRRAQFEIASSSQLIQREPLMTSHACFRVATFSAVRWLPVRRQHSRRVVRSRGRCPRGRTEAIAVLAQDQARPYRLRRPRAVADRISSNRHGGYEIHAVADYFDASAQQIGDRLGVDKNRRFSGLAGHKRLLDSGVEAVAVVNVPRFHAEHARAAIDAGCHVYAAKPVAVDVPRAMAVQEAGKLATQKKLCYLVDYQMATDPVNIEVVRRVHEGGIGRLMHIESSGISPPWAEPQVASAEDRLRSGRWLTTIALSGDVIVENNIHTINAVLWLVGRRPVNAIGRSRIVPQESPR